MLARDADRPINAQIGALFPERAVRPRDSCLVAPRSPDRVVGGVGYPTQDRPRGASPVGCGSSSLRALGHWSGGYRVASFHQNGQRRSATGRETLASLQESDTTSSSTGLCRRTSNIAAVSLIWVSDGRLASVPECRSV